MDAIRKFLDKVIPPEILASLIKKYNVKMIPGTKNVTYKMLLDTVILNKAREGDEEAAEIVKMYNLHE